MKPRVGILGGTFDPPHIGHLVLAEEARVQFHLDYVYFVPAYVPPHKQGRGISDARRRLAMVKKSIRGNPNFRTYDGEIRRKGVSFTVDTLREMKRIHPGSRLYLLMGEDNLADFSSWREPDVILRLATLVVYRRSGVTTEHADRSIPCRWLRTPALEISSTELRRRYAKGESIRYWVMPPVALFVIQHQLYRTKRP